MSVLNREGGPTLRQKNQKKGQMRGGYGEVKAHDWVPLLCFSIPHEVCQKSKMTYF